MSTVQQIIFAASGFTLTAVAWLLYSVWPLYRAATGRTRTLLGSIFALTVALGANGLFWPILLLIPPAARAAGGPLYVPVLVVFIVLLVAPPVLVVWVWRALRG